MEDVSDLKKIVIINIKVLLIFKHKTNADLFFLQT